MSKSAPPNYQPRALFGTRMVTTLTKQGLWRMRDKGPEKITRVTEAFLKMKKFNIAALKHTFE